MTAHNNRGLVRKVFPGANTGVGFFSLYDNIEDPREATKIYVLKGGPGVGKSTFMRKIGEDMAGRGYQVELLCCSSDNGSLDGVRIPELGVALIDGTAPHVVDPQNPGVVDTIIHLGDHWDKEKIRRHRKAVLELNAEVGRLFRRAYDCLAAALRFNNACEQYYLDAEALDTGGLNRLALDWMTHVFGASGKGGRGRARRLFASAISPDGPVNHLPTLMDGLERRFIVRGEPGTGKSTLLEVLLEEGLRRGHDAEVFHCSLDPARVDHVIFTQLQVGLISSSGPHTYQPAPGDVVVHTVDYVSQERLSRFEGERAGFRRLHAVAFDQALSLIAEAKKRHDEMESYYIPYMDFQAIEKRRRAVASEILELARA